jgi:YVTN family beta-propeller protein
VGNRPAEIAFDGRRVWVADQGDTTLSAIDPDHDNQVATYQLGFHPSAITVDDDRRGVWATVTA